MPETKPDLVLDDEGVCNACRSFQARDDIDWGVRKKELENILDRYRSKDQKNYDCIVPVSGGKDSHFQVIRLLELGMNPLCVTSTTCSLSEIGRKNIESIKNLGVDYIEYTTNKVIRRKLNKFALANIGDISWPEHVTIFTVPVRIAVQFDIQLIVWGENPQNEYGGPAAAAKDRVLNRRWLEEFGGLLGLRVTDMIGQEGIQQYHMIPYTYPSDAELKKAGVTGLFLGYYFPWDGYRNSLVAQGFGFRTYHKYVEGSLANYENLDNYQTGIHDYFKFLKYGFGRATDIACLHIRRGRLSREEGMQLVKKHDGKFPWKYLGKPIEEILDEIDLNMEEFVEICNKFTNKKIFKCNRMGNLVKDKVGNLTKINNDNVVDHENRYN